MHPRGALPKFRMQFPNHLSHHSPTNTGIPTITIHILKDQQGNCMRNWRETQRDTSLADE